MLVKLVWWSHVTTHCVLQGVLSFLGWTALRLKHRRLGGKGGALLAGLPSIRLKPGLLPKLKSKHRFPGKSHHHPHVLHHYKAPPLQHHHPPLITAKLEPSHELLAPDIPLHMASSRMIPSFLASPPAEKLAVRVRRKLVSPDSRDSSNIYSRVKMLWLPDASDVSNNGRWVF